MRSIRLSLIVYFVVLLLAALGGVSYFCYQSTAQAIEAKEASTRELFAAKYKENCAQVRLSFDRELLLHAKSLAQKPVWFNHQYEPLHIFGLINSNLNFYGHLQWPLWLNQAFTPTPAWNLAMLRIRPTDIRFLSPDDIEMSVDLEDGEYYQINSFRGRPLAKSDNLDGWFKLDDQTRRNIDRHGYFDDVDIGSGKPLRRVIVPVQISNYRSGLVIPRVVRLSGGKGLFKGGDKDGRTPPPQLIYVHFASETARLEQNLVALKQGLDAELEELAASGGDALAELRTRMMWIGVAAFAAIVIGGFLLVRIGLSPLNKLTEAVREVSPKDFRLNIDQHKLPRELQPIAARLQETLGELKRVFSREKQSVADISHELRTPVASLLATLEVALKKQRTPDEYREFLADCKAAGQQMSQLVERLLALARLDAGVDRMRPQDVDMNDVVKQCASLVRPLAEARGVNLRLHLNGPIPLHADPDKLREILTNLLHNAIEYNKPQGSIDLAVGRENGHVHVEVKDTGIGIPPEMRDHIFERFYRGDPSRHSDDGVHAGLGLAIVKGYVDLMGGRIGVESNTDGSTFRVDLPIRSGKSVTV